MNLSKSKYCQGVQCKKILWLEENKKEVKEEGSNDSLLETGNQVGLLAKSLFGNYIDIKYQDDLHQMVEDTQKIIAKEEVCNITEASFFYENNFCSVDILRKNKDQYEIYEVKSSTTLKDIYLEDASYQYYVLTSLGYDVRKVCVVHINKKYVRQGELEIEKLFQIEDITEIAKNKKKEIQANIKDIEDYMKRMEEPEEEIGLHCLSPYLCPYFTYCSSTLDQPNVLSIAGMRDDKKFERIKNNTYRYQDLEKDRSLNPKYLEQVDFSLHNRPPKLEVDKIKEFLDTLTEPIYFLDFETYQQVIPEYDGVSPYDRIPFQYSLHSLEKGRLYHKEFLGEAGNDPRRSLAEQLVKDIPEDVCVLAYNMSFEKSVIASLAKNYPDLRKHLLKIRDHIQDLMIPFQKRYYYVKEMEGSFSIKYVLPALFPDDPSLNYHNLEEVHNGVEAMNAFQELSQLSLEEQEKKRKHLLKYCELDTFAMVKIYQKLLTVVSK